MGDGARVLFDLEFEGWQYTDDDVELLREEFSSVDLLHVSGRWGPAAIPAASVEVVLTFVGQVLATVVVERTLEYAFRQVRDGWRRYRERRLAKGLEEPEIYRVQLRADDFTVEVNGVIDPDMAALLEVVTLMCERRSSGKLEGLPIGRIILPCHRYEGETEWHAVEPQEYADRGDMYIWFVEPRTVLPALGFYDAREDEWIPAERI